MKKIVLLAVSLAFIASIGVGGTLAFRTYLITNHAITNSATVAPASADQSPAPFALQVSNGGTLANFNVHAKGVQALSVDNGETGEGTPSVASITIIQNTYQRDLNGDPKLVEYKDDSKNSRTILTQLLPSPAFQKAKNLFPNKTGDYWNNVGAVDHIVDVSYSYTAATATGNAPMAYVRTIFAFPNPTLGVSSSFMDKIYLNWQSESNLTTFTDNKNYTDFNIDGKPYRVYVYTYPGSVASGEKTAPSLLQVAMDASITNDDVAKLSTYDGFAVKIVSQAVDVTSATTANYNTAAEALNGLFSPVSADKNPWTN